MNFAKKHLLDVITFSTNSFHNPINFAIVRRQVFEHMATWSRNSIWASSSWILSFFAIMFYPELCFEFLLKKLHTNFTDILIQMPCSKRISHSQSTASFACQHNNYLNAFSNCVHNSCKFTLWNQFVFDQNFSI